MYHSFARITLAVVLTATSLFFAVPPSHAQDNPVVITFAVPSFWSQLWGDNLIDQFEAENPNIRVELVPNDSGYNWHDGEGDISEYLTQLTDYASAADVLYVNSNSLSAAGTQAGIFLDLAPLTRTDADLAIEDFYPAAWESFQWDGGVWAMPLSVDALLLIYNSKAFDDAGLTYPSPDWTMVELVNAIRTLTRFNAEGKVEQIALMADSSNLTVLFRSLLGHGLYDPSLVPNGPQLSGSDAAAILEEWGQLEREGYLEEPVGTFDYMALPIRIDQASYNLGSYGGGDTQAADTAATLLPGGMAGLYVEGAALSSGTQHPDEAYTFIKYLSRNPLSANSFFSARPARQSLVGVDSSTGDENEQIYTPTFSPEDEALLDEALAHAIPASEMRYLEYLPGITSRMTTDNLSAADAMLEVEAKAMADYQAAIAHRENTTIFVTEPPAEVELAPGEIDLRFGLGYMQLPLANQEQWDQLMDDFVAAEPVVGHVDLGTEILDISLTYMAENYDCFFTPFNAVPGGELDALLNLDPFMDADANFDRNDIYANVLSQLQQDSRTWAYPLVIQPKVLRYNSDLFAQAGVPLPENGWTVSEFTDALTALQYSTGQAAFAPPAYDSSSLYLLIAAFGGLPFDYSTNPPTANFTDPDTISAIQQVLDLARNGVIKYQQLSLEESNLTSVSISSDGEGAIVDTDLSVMFYVPPTPDQSNPYRVVTYPSGTSYTPVSYDIGAAYISATAQNPEACYAWINTLAQRPDLLTGMPARRSMISDPLVTSTVSPDMLSLYSQLDQLLTRPDTIVIPSSMVSGDTKSMVIRFLAENWLNGAFDNYVLNNGDLEADLAQAQQYTNDFQTCVAAIPPQDPAVDEETYITQFLDCAIAVDPSLSFLTQQQ